MVSDVYVRSFDNEPPVPAGALYVAPANVPHSLWARDGDVIYQEAGVGPTANTILVGGAGGEAGRAISESEQRR